MIEKEIQHPVKRTADLAGLLRLHESCDIAKTRIIIDLKYFTFFEPLHVTLLAQHVIILANLGCPEIMIANIPDYLLKIGFVEFCRSNQVIPSTIDHIASSTCHAANEGIYRNNV